MHMSPSANSQIDKAQTIGGYELREKVQQSASGTLYRGFHPLLGREALVKLMPKDAAGHPDLMKRFQREIKLAGSLTHPNLLAALHAGVEHGMHYLVFENASGIDLQTKVSREGPRPVAESIDLICQAAEGLAFLHAQGVVHRNIKPRNLMLDAAKRVRVTNLTAALVGEEALIEMDDDDDLTRQGQVVGTAEFLAPEQAFDSHSVDARGDVYSLGCTLYYLLTGEVPYPVADNSHRKAAAHVQRPIPSLKAKRADASAELDAVFKRMLAKMPVDRYQTMQDVIADLQRVAKGTAPELGAAVAARPGWKWPAAVGVAGALAGAGLVAIANWLL
jgi:serine/threonine protein kinase